jgi:hypothetical protein
MAVVCRHDKAQMPKTKTKLETKLKTKLMIEPK